MKIRGIVIVKMAAERKKVNNKKIEVEQAMIEKPKVKQAMIEQHNMFRKKLEEIERLRLKDGKK
jgi:hypothetical protein